jgi:hypothetical protein
MAEATLSAASLLGFRLSQLAGSSLVELGRFTADELVLQKLVRAHLRHAAKLAMELVWGRRRDGPESNMATALRRLKPVTADRSGSGGKGRRTEG